MKWYYHENSDNFFVGPVDEDFGFETEFVQVVGDAVTRDVEELRGLLQSIGHYLKDDEHLEDLVSI